MSRFLPQLTRRELWALADPRLTEPDVVVVMEQILELVGTDWKVEASVDLRAPLMRQYLSDHRLWPLLPLDAVRPSVRPELRHRQVAISASQMRLRSVATEVLEQFDAEGIESRVLKGLATGELDYPNYLMRHTGDVDLAVRPERLDDAVRVLRGHGYGDRYERFSPYLSYGCTLEAPNGVEVDLHARLSRRSPLGDRLFQDLGEPLSMLPGYALPAAHRLVHASGHFMISPPGTRRLSGLFDITRLHACHDVDLEKARRFAADLRIEALVGAGLWVEAMLSERVDVIAQLDTWKAPDWLERNTRLVPERRLLLDHLGRYREVPRGRRLRYLPAWLLPTRRQRKLLIGSARRTATRLTQGRG
ncbi:MAG: nucleotidyltransferase family protein [Acidimicrobiales bacterium]|nr:nucleotidyltransferase family protein [Acidimicrobiales bacterium]MDG2218390.1 nucleotidyltransferase family protein [Acidimicrobiales bacterium]